MKLNRIIKFLIGNKAAEEKEILEHWKDDAAANIDALKQLHKIEAISDQLKDYQPVDVQKAWTSIDQKIKVRPLRTDVIRKIAAVFILGAVFSYGLYQFIGSGKAEIQLITAQTRQDVMLEDGSKVILDGGSKLEKKAFRTVSLQGRAFFDIHSDANRPFIVNMLHGALTVLGTEFNIITTKEKTSIYVKEGKVRVEYNGQMYILNAGDQLVMTDSNVETNPPSVTTADIWVNQELRFENQSMTQVLESVAEYYNVSISYRNNMAADRCKINTSFKQASLDQVLKELSIVAGLKYEVKQNRITILGFKC